MSDISRLEVRLRAASDVLASYGFPKLAEAVVEAASLRSKVEELERERDEARKLASLGCDAADGGAHHIMAQGTYRFCAKCGSTIKAPTLHERARAAEARALAAEAKVERLTEANSKLHRRAQMAEAVNQSVEGILAGWCEHARNYDWEKDGAKRLLFFWALDDITRARQKAQAKAARALSEVKP